MDGLLCRDRAAEPRRGGLEPTRADRRPSAGPMTLKEGRVLGPFYLLAAVASAPATASWVLSRASAVQGWGPCWLDKPGEEAVRMGVAFCSHTDYPHTLLCTQPHC